MMTTENENLLEETEALLQEKGKGWDDIAWIGLNDQEINIEDFKRIANTEYEPGFGTQEVARSLLVVGKDFWLERHEYDGSEWWEYKALPLRPKIETKNLMKEDMFFEY